MMVLGFLQLGFVFLGVLLEIVRVGQPVQMTAERGLRFVLFRPNDGIETAPAFGHIGVAPEEIHRARAEAEQLRQPCIVVVALRDVAIRTIFRRADAARGVREMRIERLAAIALGADGLLLRINPLAVRVLRADDHGGRRTQNRQAVGLHRAVNAQLENIVAHDLRVV